MFNQLHIYQKLIETSNSDISLWHFRLSHRKEAYWVEWICVSKTIYKTLKDVILDSFTTYF